MDKNPINEESCYLCPVCGSASVDYGALVGSTATCRICSWEGQRELLVSAPFAHTNGDRVGIALELSNDIRRIVGSPAFMKDQLQFLERWGFIDRKLPQKELVRHVARYASAVARGMLKAVIEEREALEKEAFNERSKQR